MWDGFPRSLVRSAPVAGPLGFDRNPWLLNPAEVSVRVLPFFFRSFIVSVGPTGSPRLVNSTVNSRTGDHELQRDPKDLRTRYEYTPSGRPSFHRNREESTGMVWGCSTRWTAPCRALGLSSHRQICPDARGLIRLEVGF